jgi:hypothetical protein
MRHETDFSEASAVTMEPQLPTEIRYLDMDIMLQ